MKVDLAQIGRNLEFVENTGIWKSRSTSLVSYPDHGNDDYFSIEEQSFWFRHRNDCILSVLKSFPPNGTFFDVGGGNGHVSRALQQSGRDVVLVEPGPAGARNARRRGIGRVVQSSLADADFSPCSLPAVGLFDVLEHVRDDANFLRALHSLLVDDGRLYITVPAYHWLWSHEDTYAEHWRRYTASGLSTLLLRSGFHVEFLTYFFGFLVAPIFLFRALPYRFGLRPRADKQTAIRSDHLPHPFAKRILEFLMTRELS